jgi:tetratricopeptide (TPR) repeat protein
VVDLNSQVEVAADIAELEIARQGLASLNPDDEAYFSALNMFASNLMSHFARSGNPNDLDEGISRTKQVLDLAPPGHSFRAAALTNMGQALRVRFKLRGDTDDLTQAVSYLEAAVASCTPEHSLYLPFVGNLASGLLNRYRIYGDVMDLDRIIEISSTALSASPTQRTNRDSLLNNLATAFKERFEKQGNKADLDTALTHCQSCLDLRPSGHPSRHSALGNLADTLVFRFEVDGHLQDLENAAGHYISALQLRSPGQEGYLLYVTCLGAVYWRLFNVEGKIETLEAAIGCYKTAMEHSTAPNLDHSRLLDNYGAALQSRYSLLGNVDDLDQAIQYLTTSSRILPQTYSGMPITLFNLGVMLVIRFDATGNITDLDSSIEKLASALQLCTPGYYQRPVILSVYGRALSARFGARGDMQDLILAASACKDALTLLSPTQPTYPSTVTNLTSTLLDCIYRLGSIEECQTTIDHCDRALVSTRSANPVFISLKINRAKAFLQKFKYGGEEKDIETCIAAFREIIPTIPEGHTEHVHAHLQLGIALETRFKLSADQKDLDESIAFFRVAHRHCKRGDSASVCMELGTALRERFEYHQDSGETLDEAIVLLAEVEEILSPMPGAVDYKASLVNLGIALFMRFQAQRSRPDLDMAIERVSRALTLPTSSEQFLIPFVLATFLSVRYTEDEDLADLERCVELFGIAAEQTPPKHLVRSNLCRNYGHALVKLGSHRDRLQHLNAAIVFFKEALEHLPASHYDQPLTCMRLAEVLHERAKLLRDDNGLYDAINLLRGVIQTLPEDNPVLRSVYHTAAKLSISMFVLSEQQAPFFMEEIFRYYAKAVHYTYAHSFMSVVTALEWAEHAEKFHHSSALLAYQTSLGYLYQHLLATASIESRRTALLDKHWVRQTGTLATDATSCAIARGELALAVEMSEQGRGLLWSQLSQSRTPLDALRSAGEEGRTLASNFERVSAQLARSTVAPVESTMTTSRLTAEEAARRYRQLSKELEDIVARIRRQAGFQSFLERASFESLQRAAVGGPVILVNVSRQRCDALIVLHDAPPRLIPLPDTSLEELTTLSTRFYRMLRATSGVGEEKMREREVVVVLRTLWDTLVHPIVDELGPLIPRGARIWWCPTSKLTTLPLHAAGPYRKGALNLPNIYVSSYTPTLAALIRARHQPPSSPTPPPPPAFIAIGQAEPPSSSGPALQSVSAELTLVRSLLLPYLLASSPPATFSALEGAASTADAALAVLSTHGWAHLACHGHPNVERPFNAAFALRDRAMTVLDVVGGHASDTTPPGEFAFLSACHTAVGDRHAPDEIIHLAAAMQFAGFRSVIGTMWAVDDGMARHMVRAFYECMFGGTGSMSDGAQERWDCTRAARALNRASKSVDKNLVSIDQRIVFIHIGA